MTKSTGLKTLGDYRRTAKDSLFNLGIKPNNKNTSFYDAIRTALVNCRGLIIQSHIDPSIPGTWEGIIYPNSKYEMRNIPLFNSIKLMEFAITYKAQSIEQLFPNWPKRPDVKASVFTSAGISYLEAAFNFVHELGRDIIGILQNAYKKYTKEGNVIYLDPFMFLNKTPTVDNLEINPVPDIIIKTWYDSILVGVRNYFPENQFSKQKLEAEFNQTHIQLEYEWNVWKNGKTGGTDLVKPPAEIEMPSYSRSQSIQELIAKGENHTLEFKETFQYNTKNKVIDKSVRHDALKTIAGFLNADGGTLLIGISDSGKVKGIGIDKKAMNRANNDKFELDVRNHIAGKNSKFKPSAIGYVKFEFEELQGHTICIINVQPLPKSEILHFDDGVYIRDGNKTLKLTGADLTSWIKRRELESKTKPKIPKADEPTQNGIITQDSQRAVAKQGEKPDDLLDNKILNLARRRIKVKFTERRKALSEEVERIMSKLGFEGTSRSSGAFKLVRDACDSEINIKADIVWGSIQDVLNAVGLPITEIPATALKQEVAYHIEAIVEEISKYMIQRLPMSKSEADYFDFENIKCEVKEKFDAEVELYIASLPNEPTKTGQENKGQVKTMIRPTIEKIDEIIDKLKTLKKKQAAFVSAKGKALDSDKLGYGIATGHIRKPLKYTGSIEELIKGTAGLDAKLSEPLLMEDILAGGMPTKTLAEVIPTLHIDKLQRLLNKFLPELEGTEIPPDNKYRLQEIKADLSRELKRKEKAKDGAAKIIETMDNYEKIRVKPKDYWPEDIQHLMSEIITLLYTYWDYFKTNDLWEIHSHTSIEYLIKAGIPSKLDEVSQELEKIKYKMEVESQQSVPEKPVETEQEREAINKPNSKARKIFGDTLNLPWCPSINYRNLWHKIKNWRCKTKDQ